MTVPVSPAASAWRRTVSDSAAFSRQPKLMTSIDIWSSGGAGLSEHCGRKLAFELELERPAHQHMIVALAPFDGKIAARQRDADLASRALGTNGGNSGGASGRGAGAGQPGAAFPRFHNEMIRPRNLSERDIRALGKDRMVFEH